MEELFQPVLEERTQNCAYSVAHLDGERQGKRGEHHEIDTSEDRVMLFLYVVVPEMLDGCTAVLEVQILGGVVSDFRKRQVCLKYYRYEVKDPWEKRPSREMHAELVEPKLLQIILRHRVLEGHFIGGFDGEFVRAQLILGARIQENPLFLMDPPQSAGGDDFHDGKSYEKSLTSNIKSTLVPNLGDNIIDAIEGAPVFVVQKHLFYSVLIVSKFEEAEVQQRTVDYQGHEPAVHDTPTGLSE